MNRLIKLLPLLIICVVLCCGGEANAAWEGREPVVFTATGTDRGYLSYLRMNDMVSIVGNDGIQKGGFTVGETLGNEDVTGLSGGDKIIIFDDRSNFTEIIVLQAGIDNIDSPDTVTEENGGYITVHTASDNPKIMYRRISEPSTPWTAMAENSVSGIMYGTYEVQIEQSGSRLASPVRTVTITLNNPVFTHRVTWQMPAGSEGSFSVFEGGKQLISGDEVAENTPVTIVTAPNTSAGYAVDNVLCKYHASNGDEHPVSVAKTGDNTYSFSMPVSYAEISVSFAKTYNIKVNGEAFTSSKMTIAGVTYYPESSSLIMNNAAIESLSVETGTSTRIYLAGTNNVSSGIRSSASLEIQPYTTGGSPSGTLYARGGQTDNSYGIMLTSGDLTVAYGASVRAAGASGCKNGFGVNVPGRVRVAGNLTAYGADGAGTANTGIYCGSLIVEKTGPDTGGTVFANALTCNTYVAAGTGIYTTGDITVETNGYLNVSTASVSGASRGIVCGGNLTSSGNISISTGDSLQSDSVGILVSGTFTVAGGSVLSQAENAGSGISCGVFGKVMLSGGEIEACGKNRAFSAEPGYKAGYTPKVSAAEAGGILTPVSAPTAQTYSLPHVHITPKSVIIKGPDNALKAGERYQIEAWPKNYSFSWSSSDPSCVSVDQSGTVTALKITETPVTITATGINPEKTGYETATVFISVIEAPADTPDSPPEPVYPDADVYFKENSLSLVSRGGVKSVGYYFYPSSYYGEITVACSDTTGAVIKYWLDEHMQQIAVSAVANGTARIDIKPKHGNGRGDTLYVTVAGVSYGFTYKQNDGVWFYDNPGNFTVRCSGPYSELTGIYMDGILVPQYSEGRPNWTIEAGIESTITFTNDYMQTLAHSRHTLSFSYPAAGQVSTTIWVQSVKDTPKTGDDASAAAVPVMVFSFFSAAGCFAAVRKNRRKDNGV